MDADLFSAAEKNSFFLRPGDPLSANFQAVSFQRYANALWRVAIREEKPDGFTAGEIIFFALDFNPPGAAEMKVRHHALQTARGISFNSKTQFPVARFHSEVEQERQQPVARRCVVILR